MYCGKARLSKSCYYESPVTYEKDLQILIMQHLVIACDFVLAASI